MSSGFVTESELAEARRKRQEEWDKVRTDDQPLEAPEEVIDPRPLYQRLEEQKNKKEAEYEEAHKLKNMIRGLDDDEVGFLELVEQSKASVARQISLEEQREMQEFRERVSSVQDAIERERLLHLSGVRQPPPKKPATKNIRNMLQGVIVKKRNASDAENGNTDQPSTKVVIVDAPQKPEHLNGHSPKGDKLNGVSTCDEVRDLRVLKQMRVIGILPGIGPYKDSSDSDCSSDSDDDPLPHAHYDLLGRKQECKSKLHDKS